MVGILALLASLGAGSLWLMLGRTDASDPVPTLGADKASADAIFAEARANMAACRRLDSADGFGERIEECQSSFNSARTTYDLGHWSDAAEAFTNVAEKCRTLIAADVERDNAKTAASLLSESIKAAKDAEAQKFAKARFESATKTANRGRGEFGDFKFAAAAATYESARGLFDLAAQEAEQVKIEEASRKEVELKRKQEEERKAKETRQAEEARRGEEERIQTGSGSDDFDSLLADMEGAATPVKVTTQLDGKPTPRTFVVSLKERVEPKHGDTKVLELPGGATMEMIYVGPGTFTMGSPTSEDGHEDVETQHRVTLTKGFWLGKYEVTQKQWQSVMGFNPSYFKGDSNPVDNVSWNVCQEFVQKVDNAARSQFGGSARLPTEAEWEYACRAGMSGAYAGTGRLDDMGWYAENSGGKTHPVGQRRPNAWGLYDMHGNVYEWCSDWYGGDYYVNSPTSDPQGSDSGCSRVLRGGCWNNRAHGCRSANRDWVIPGLRYDDCGFRLCCSVKPLEQGADNP